MRYLTKYKMFVRLDFINLGKISLNNFLNKLEIFKNIVSVDETDILIGPRGTTADQEC